MRWSVGSYSVRSRGRVTTINCRASRGTGRPYTKMILPEHLVPRSPFWSQGLVNLLERGRDGEPGFTNTACEALGCVDPRTARKHIRYVSAAEKPSFLPTQSCSPPIPFVQRSGLSSRHQSVPDPVPAWDKFLKNTQELYGSLVVLSLRPLLWLGLGLESWRRLNRS
jgi:hypothetical protein